MPSSPDTDGRALVTGGSSGIGAALSRRLAARGHDLVLVARSEDRLVELGEELARDHGVEVELLIADLTVDEELEVVEKRVRDVDEPIDLLVNNAGFGAYGRFADLELERQDRMIDLKVTAPGTMPAAARMGPDRVAEGALKAYDRGEAGYVPGLLNKLGAYGAMLGPSALGRRFAGLIQRRRISA